MPKQESNNPERGGAISIQDVTFAFHTEADHCAPVLVRLSLSVSFGEIVTLIGESGIGKSTLLNLAANIVRPTSGKVDSVGVVSYLQQEDLMLPFRSVLQNVCLAAEISGSLSQSLLGAASVLLARMKLSDAVDKLPSELSGGMRRRVALARQLLLPADILLLDEPLGEQDRAMREILEDLLWARAKQMTNAILLVTHDLESAVAVADRILVLGPHKRIGREWHCPHNLISIKPSDRRTRHEFADCVADVWRCLWEATDYGGQ